LGLTGRPPVYLYKFQYIKILSVIKLFRAPFKVTRISVMNDEIKEEDDSDSDESYRPANQKHADDA
jgi:hypothetical protein